MLRILEQEHMSKGSSKKGSINIYIRKTQQPYFGILEEDCRFLCNKGNKALRNQRLACH